MNSYALILLVWNIIVMFIYGLDKMFAKMQKRRIRENTLLICTYLLGGYGGILGMVLFNHKTSKIKFRILVPLALILVTGLVYYLKEISQI